MKKSSLRVFAYITQNNYTCSKANYEKTGGHMQEINKSMWGLKIQELLPDSTCVWRPMTPPKVKLILNKEYKHNGPEFIMGNYLSHKSIFLIRFTIQRHVSIYALTFVQIIMKRNPISKFWPYVHNLWWLNRQDKYYFK